MTAKQKRYQELILCLENSSLDDNLDDLFSEMDILWYSMTLEEREYFGVSDAE